MAKLILVFDVPESAQQVAAAFDIGAWANVHVASGSRGSRRTAMIGEHADHGWHVFDAPTLPHVAAAFITDSIFLDSLPARRLF